MFKCHGGVTASILDASESVKEIGGLFSTISVLH